MTHRALREIDVYGRLLLLEWTDVTWRAYDPGDDGKRRPARDVLIPAFVRTETEVEEFLADLLDERASPEHSEIRWRR